MNKKLMSLSIIAVGLLCAVTYFAMKDDKIEFSEVVHESIEKSQQQTSKIENNVINGSKTNNNQGLINQRIASIKNNKPTEKNGSHGLVSANIEELKYESENGRLYKIEDQSYVNLEKKEVYLDYKHQIDRFENEFIKQTLDVSLPNYILEHMKGRIEEYKNMQGIPEGYFDEERYIQNYAFFQYIKPIEFESVIENLIIERLNSFEFFVLENGNKLKKIVFKD